MVIFEHIDNLNLAFENALCPVKKSNRRYYGNEDSANRKVFCNVEKTKYTN